MKLNFINLMKFKCFFFNNGPLHVALKNCSDMVKILLTCDNLDVNLKQIFMYIF